MGKKPLLMSVTLWVFWCSARKEMVKAYGSGRWWMELQEGLTQLGRKSEHELDEEKGHLQNTSQLLFRA